MRMMLASADMVKFNFCSGSTRHSADRLFVDASKHQAGHDSMTRSDLSPSKVFDS